MKDTKNYLIAILAGLLVLTLTTQPSIGAGNSKEAKIVEYDNCLQIYIKHYIDKSLDLSNYRTYTDALDEWKSKCAKYKP